MSDIVIGIDLGTTNSEVAVVLDGKVEVLKVEGERELLPSVVGLAEDGELLVGTPARNQYPLYPERTIRSIKRRMGNDEKVRMGELEFSPQEISAIILKRLKAVAEARLGHPVQRAVITVPAYFSDAQRQATRDAGEIAGLVVERIINEPTAAALTYESGHTGRKHILVYDLGGGTFDVSLVRMDGDVVEVLASHGNNQLGGDDFDQRIVEHLVEHLKESRGADPSGSVKAMARIRRAAETAKIALSDAPFALIEEEYLLEKEDGPVHLSMELARHDYEAMIQGYIDETLEAVHIALRDAGMSVSQVDEILLVGGATRTPLIPQRLEQELKLQPRSELNPDLCVAAGAAIQGAVIGGRKVAGVLVDITPYTFGTSALGEMNGELYPHVYVPLIRKNTVIPTSKSEAFFTIHDGQEAVEVKVYQGEEKDALNNTEIGEYRIEGLSNVPAGNPIVTTFSLDINGILHVRSREKDTGLEKSITIDNAIARFDQQQVDQAKERIGKLFGDQPAGEAPFPDHMHGHTHAHTHPEARALIHKAEKLMDQANEDDREDLVNLVEILNDSLADDDHVSIKAAAEALKDLIYYLES